MSRLINYDADPCGNADQIVLKKRRRVFTLLLVSYKPALKVLDASSSRLAEGGGRPSEARDDMESKWLIAWKGCLELPTKAMASIRRTVACGSKPHSHHPLCLKVSEAHTQGRKNAGT